MVSFFAVPRFVGVTEIGALGELWEFLNFCAAEIGSDRGVEGGGQPWQVAGSGSTLGSCHPASLLFSQVGPLWSIHLIGRWKLQISGQDWYQVSSIPNTRHLDGYGKEQRETRKPEMITIVDACLSMVSHGCNCLGYLLPPMR
jgi:hypothetical protein